MTSHPGVPIKPFCNAGFCRMCGRRKQVIAPLQQTTTTTNQLIAINTLSSCYLKEPIENVGQFGGTNRQDGL
jgi:hypothetical protein